MTPMAYHRSEEGGRGGGSKERIWQGWRLEGEDVERLTGVEVRR